MELFYATYNGYIDHSKISDNGGSHACLLTRLQEPRLVTSQNEQDPDCT